MPPSKDASSPSAARWFVGGVSFVAAVIGIFTFVTGRYSLSEALFGRHKATSAGAASEPLAKPGVRRFGADLPAAMDDALSLRFDNRYRVLQDKDGLVVPYDLEHFVLPRRKEFRFYPYVVIGDFDADKASDLAALVRNTENNYVRLAVLWGRGDRDLNFYDGQLCTAISFVPANEFQSYWEKAPVALRGDAILVECYEKSAWLLYWDGTAFQTYWMAD